MGATAVIGSGSFAQMETQRRIKVDIAADSEAYLRMEQHPESDWSEDDPNATTEFTVEEDDRGHLGIGVDAVKNGTVSRFDNVFRVCNAGKQCVCVWIDGKTGEYPERVTFYDSETGESIDGSENAVQLEVGGCVDLGIEVDAVGLEGRNRLLDGVTVNAEDECPCTSTSSESAWADGDEFSGANWFTYFEYTGGEYTTDLVTGRDKRVVGEVKVVETNNGEMEVTCSTDTDRRIVKTHLAVGDEEPEAERGNEWYENGWLNMPGNPIPGRLPEGDEYSPGVNETSYPVDVNDKELPVYVAAHAVVEVEE